ncbi:unnamed protein product [Paramecium octaurelia]|uniref:Transmembrane protein n=1 Tax=Paramecium octaurelia TaxID=43137 RepID=A0A8S1UAD2_PAROT|nr:unnamed protein product [Paramecium octaurelia]
MERQRIQQKNIEKILQLNVCPNEMLMKSLYIVNNNNQIMIRFKKLKKKVIKRNYHNQLATSMFITISLIITAIYTQD